MADYATRMKEMENSYPWVHLAKFPHFLGQMRPDVAKRVGDILDRAGLVSIHPDAPMEFLTKERPPEDCDEDAKTRDALLPHLQPCFHEPDGAVVARTSPYVPLVLPEYWAKTMKTEEEYETYLRGCPVLTEGERKAVAKAYAAVSVDFSDYNPSRAFEAIDFKALCETHGLSRRSAAALLDYNEASLKTHRGLRHADSMCAMIAAALVQDYASVVRIAEDVLPIAEQFSDEHIEKYHLPNQDVIALRDMAKIMQDPAVAALPGVKLVFHGLLVAQAGHRNTLLWMEIERVRRGEKPKDMYYYKHATPLERERSHMGIFD